MAEFYVSLPEDEVAKQIAILLNKQNKLIKIHNKHTIMGSTIKYFVHLITTDGAIHKPIVAGCAGLLQENPYLSTIKHVSVLPKYGRQGVAKDLIQLAIDHCVTNTVRMTIREDNYPSLMLAKSMSFEYITKNFNKDHYVIIVGRRRTL